MEAAQAQCHFINEQIRRTTHPPTNLTYSKLYMSTHALNKHHQSTSLSVTGQLNCYPHTHSHIHSCAFKKKNNEKKRGGGEWQRKQSTHHRKQTPHSKLHFLYPFMLFLYLLPSPSPISFFFLSLLIQQALALFYVLEIIHLILQ